MSPKVICPKCGGFPRQGRSVDSHAYCDTCKEFVYVADQFIIVDGIGKLKEPQP